MDAGTVEATLRLRDEFADVFRRAGKLARDLDKTLGGIGGTGLGRTITQVESIGSAARMAGAALTAGLTVPLVGIGAASVRAFTSFEGAINGVLAALDPTVDELQRIEAAALEWGAKTKYSATESAQALGELGKAGFTVSQSIAALPATLQMATIAEMSLSDAATLTADTLTQFNLAVSDAGRVNDVLTVAAQRSTIDVRQLGESLKYVGPVAAGFGLSIESTAAALAAFGNAGIKADMAGTALRNVLTDIENPTKGLGEVLSKLGIDTLRSADGTIRLAHVIDTLRAAGATAGDVMAAFGDRAGPAMVAMVKKGSDGLKTLETDLNNSAGAAKKAADVYMSGLGGALEEMRGSIETAGVAIGKVLEPAVRAASKHIGQLADWVGGTLVPAFKALPGPVQASIGVLLGVAAAAGPVLLAFGAMAGSITAIASAGVTGAAILAFGKMALVIGGVTAAVIGTGALVSAFLRASGAMEPVKAMALGIYASMSKAVSALASEVWAKFASILSSTGTILKGVFDVMVALYGPVWKLAAGIGGSSTAMSILKGIFDASVAPMKVTLWIIEKIAAALAAAAGKMSEFSAAYRKFTGQASAAATTTAPTYDMSAAQKIFAGVKPDMWSQAFGGSQPGGALKFHFDAAGAAAGVAAPRLDAFGGSAKGAGKAASELADALAKVNREAASAAHDDLMSSLGVNEYAAAATAVDQYQKASSAGVTVSKDQQDQWNRAIRAGMTASQRLFGIVPKGWNEIADATEGALQGAKTGFVGAYTPLIKLVDGAKELKFAMMDVNDVVDAQRAFLLSSFSALSALAPGITMLNEAVRGNESGLDDFLTEGDEKTKDWTSSLSNLSRAFADLAQISGGSLDGVIGQIGQAVGLMETGAQAGSLMKSGWDNKDNKDIAKYTDLIAGAVAAYGTMQAATDKRSKGGRIASGAMAGGAIGKSFAGGYGQIVGMAVGAIWGAARNPAWADIAERVGKDMGVTISNEMAKQIAANAKDMFGGDRQAAQIFNLHGILEEAGGVTAGNFGTMVGVLRDSFVMLEKGVFSAEQATQAIDATFDQFVAAGTDGLGFIAAELRDITDQMGRFGLESKKVTEFLQGQAQAVSEGITAALKGAPSVTAYDEIGSAVETARKALADLNDETERGAEWTAKHASASDALNMALGKQAAAAATAHAEMKDLGVLSQAAVFSAVAAGDSLNTAIGKNGPVLAELADAYADLGIRIQDIDDPLTRFLLTQNEISRVVPGAMAAVNGLGQAIVGLTNLNMLNAESFGAVQRTAANNYTAIQAAVAAVGGTTKDALIPMQDYLQRAAKAAAELQLPLDENTQMLINQSKELGIWKDLAPTAADLQRRATESLTTAIERMTNALLGIPTELPNPFQNWTVPEMPSGTGSGGDYPAPTMLAKGGVLNRPTFVAGEAGAEVVSPLDDYNRTMLSAMSSGASSRPVNITVRMDGQVIARASLPYLADELELQGI